MTFVSHPVSVFGTLGVLVMGWIVISLGRKYIDSHAPNPKEQYRRQRLLTTIVVVIGGAIIIGLWAKLVPHASTFLGLIGAGLAVALREPLLSIAGRIAIFFGHMYPVGDRIEINKLSGDVIDVGFFYTRMMEIGKTGLAATSTAAASSSSPTHRCLALPFSITPAISLT